MKIETNFIKLRQARVAMAKTFYEVSKANGEKEEAHMWAGELMGLKAVSEDSDIVRELRRDKVPLFERDYRRGVDFTPKWAGGCVPSKLTISMITSEHELHREDSSNDAYVKVPARDVELEITEVKSPGYSKRLNDLVRQMDRECDRAEFSLDISYMHSIGEVAVHTIKAPSSFNLACSDLGFIMTTRPSVNSNIRAIVMLHRENMKKSHININTATKLIIGAYERELRRLNKDKEFKIVSIDNLYKKANRS